MVQRPGPVKVRDRPISKQIKLKVNELINRACQRQLRRVIRRVNVQRPLVNVDPCNRVEPNTELFRDQTDALGKSARRAEQINEPNLNIWAVTAAINNRRAAEHAQETTLLSDHRQEATTDPSTQARSSCVDH